MLRYFLPIVIIVSASLALPYLWDRCYADEAQTSLTAGNGLSGAAHVIPWGRLAPENGRPFNDPFVRLSREQLAELSYVARIRRLIAQQKIDADGDDAADAIRLSAKLSRQGIDVNWLLVQRQRVPDIRRRQITECAESVAASVKSQPVELVGFATNIPTARTAFLLLPTATMCSHSTSPSPLHVVIVEAQERQPITSENTPVRVRGFLTAHSSTTKLLNGSGVQVFESAYRIVPSSIEVLSSKTGRLSNVHPDSLTTEETPQDKQGINQ